MNFLDEMGSLVFESIEKSTNAYLYAMHGESDVTRWSQNALDSFELPDLYVKGNIELWSTLIHPNDIHIYSDDIQKIIVGEKDFHQCEYRVRKRNGEYVWVRCAGQATRKPDGTLAWFIGLVRECTSLDKIDYTTKLLSIYEFRGNMDVALKNNLLDGGLLLLGVDNFKQINTMYSYSFGDQVLLKVAETLQNICPPTVDLYRIEGDKFAFVCPHYNQKEVVQLFNTATESMQNLLLADVERVRLSASAGALMVKRHYDNVDEVHKDLEHALSVSKQKEAGTITFFSEELLEESLRDLRLREELRRCVENDCEGFELYFQPIMQGDTSVIHSCEALLRWNNEKFPRTFPDKFIPILEETGLIVPVGKWVGRSALAFLKEWRKVIPDLKVNVNVSYVQIVKGDLHEQIVNTLEEFGMPPQSLVVEITESCDIKDLQHTINFVENIRKNGIEVALDDFGTGYSSISILQHIPADWIKLDHNFVSKIKDNEFDRNIVIYLMSLCHSLGLKVCVEGVEDEMCCKLVRLQKAEAIQGYHFSRPIPADDFYKKYVISA